MHTSNVSQESRSKDLVWYLLGEYSLSKFLSDAEEGDKITAGLLSQTVRELRIPIERVENIERALRSSAGEALAHTKQGRVELPGRIRIFCEKKMIDEEMRGGWGYFIVERSGGQADSLSRPYSIVDLYLYKEGE